MLSPSNAAFALRDILRWWARSLLAAWLAIHALLLTIARARMEAIIEWEWQYFTGEHPGQIIDR